MLGFEDHLKKMNLRCPSRGCTGTFLNSNMLKRHILNLHISYLVQFVKDRGIQAIKVCFYSFYIINAEIRPECHTWISYSKVAPESHARKSHPKVILESSHPKVRPESHSRRSPRKSHSVVTPKSHTRKSHSTVQWCLDLDERKKI